MLIYSNSRTNADYDNMPREVRAPLAEWSRMGWHENVEETLIKAWAEQFAAFGAKHSLMNYIKRMWHL